MDETAPCALLISYHFPPDPVVGSLRWQEMSRRFAERGWNVDVITRDFSDLAGLDRARLQRLPIGTRVFSVADREPLLNRIQRRAWPHVRRLIRRGRANAASEPSGSGMSQRSSTPRILREYLTWLEVAHDRNWARAAGRSALALARLRPYGVIISSGPPHLAHLAGAHVVQREPMPFVADMRDPWSLVERLSHVPVSSVWLSAARKYEARVIRAASLITMNTEAACAAMRARYPGAAEKIHVIRNGADDELIPSAPRDGAFRIRFAGSIYLDRDPRLLFRAASRVIRDLELSPAQFKIEFVGDVDRYADTPTLQIAAQEGIAQYVTLGGQLPRREVLGFLAGATMLISLPQDSDFAIPAKIYEYVKMPAWLLILARSGSATAELLAGSDASVVEPTDADTMTATIRQRFLEFRQGCIPSAVGGDGRFDRSVQADKLLQLIAEQVAQSRRP